MIGLTVHTVTGLKELYLGEEAVVGTIVRAEVQCEISLMQSELVEARGEKKHSS